MFCGKDCLSPGLANTPTISQAAPDSFLPRRGTDVQPAFPTDRRAVRPGAGQQLPRLSWQGPFPATRRSLGSPPRAFGTAGDDPAGRAVASGKGNGAFRSSKAKPTIAIRQVREAKAPEHSQGAPRTATVADDVKSLALLGGGMKGTRVTANQQQNNHVTVVSRGLCPPAEQNGH